ncbi:hypothetical protein DMENIID0001_101530 [Sergentomyia squamirostris]
MPRVIFSEKFCCLLSRRQTGEGQSISVQCLPEINGKLREARFTFRLSLSHREIPSRWERETIDARRFGSVPVCLEALAWKSNEFPAPSFLSSFDLI